MNKGQPGTGPLVGAEFGISAEKIMETLGQAGYKSTSTRRVVVDLILRRAGYFTAAGLCEDTRLIAPGIGRATVFRTLDLLNELGLLEKVHLADGSHRYTICQSQRHHLICASCGSASFFEESSLSDLLQQLAQRTRFQIRGHRLEVFGVCEKCQTTEAQSLALAT